MRYELYGVGRDAGFVTECGAFRSRVAALDAASQINNCATPYFCVVELQRKASVPIGLYLGRVRDGFASIAHAPHVYNRAAPGKHEALSRDYLSRFMASLSR